MSNLLSLQDILDADQLVEDAAPTEMSEDSVMEFLSAPAPEEVMRVKGQLKAYTPEELSRIMTVICASIFQRDRDRLREWLIGTAQAMLSLEQALKEAN